MLKRSAPGRHRRPRPKHSQAPAVAATVALTAAVVGGLNVPQAVGDEQLRRASAAGGELAAGGLRLPAPASDSPLGTAGILPSPTDRDRAALALRLFEARQAEALRASRATARQAAVDKAREKAREAAERKAAARKAAARKAAAREAAAHEAAERKAAAERARRARMWTPPLSGYRLSAPFGASSGLWSSGRHTGQDFAAPYGTPVRAVGGGVVTSAGWAGAYGIQVVIRHSDGTETWYNHMSAALVSRGGRVGAGQLIGRVGSTGNSTGNHLHLEVRPGGASGAPVDPLAWLRARGVRI